MPEADAALCPTGLLDVISRAHSDRAWPIHITGPTGTGKTSAAARCFRTALWEQSALATIDQQWPRWIEWPDFCSGLIAARIDGITIDYEDGSRYLADEKAWWRRWSTRRLVVVDEIGLRSANDVRLEAMWQLLEHRRGLPTILTSNLDEMALARTFDDRVLSRFIAGTWINLTGNDRRVAGAARRTITIGE